MLRVGTHWPDALRPMDATPEYGTFPAVAAAERPASVFPRGAWEREHCAEHGNERNHGAKLP